MKPTAYWGFSGDICEFYMITIPCPTIFSCSVIHRIYFLHCLQEFQYRFEECIGVFEHIRCALDPIMYNKSFCLHYPIISEMHFPILHSP